MKDKKLTSNGGILSAIIIAAVTFSLCAPALAVEDGQGTNVVRSLRATQAIELNGERITGWDDLSDYVGDMSELEAATNALNTRVGSLEASTNALNNTLGAETTARTASDAALSNSVSGLRGATNALNGRIGTAESDIDTLQTDVTTAETDIAVLKTSTNTLNAADTALKASTNALNADVTALKGATNALNSGVNELKSRTNAWNLGIYAPGAQQIANNATTVSVAQAVAKIGNSGTAVTFSGCAKQIADGTAGQFLTIMCTNNAPIRLNNGQGVALAEGVSFSMNANDVIQLVYDGSQWVEVHRADN